VTEGSGLSGAGRPEQLAAASTRRAWAVVGDGRSDPSWMGRPCRAAAFAAAGRSWWLLCLGSAAAGSSEKALLDTTDGGRIWTTASQVMSLTAPPRPGAIPLQEPHAWLLAPGQGLWRTTDGRHWRAL